MAQVERFGTWTFANGASWNGAQFTIPPGASIFQNVNLTGVPAITFQYWSDIESWSHLIGYIDGVSVFDLKRSTNIRTSKSIPTSYTGIHEVKFYASPGMSRSCCMRYLYALATVADVPIITGVSFNHRKNHGPAKIILTGSGFVSGMILKLKREGHPDLLCTIDQLTPGEVSCDVDLFGPSPGQWKVISENNGQTSEATAETEIEESVCYPAMALKRGKTGDTPMDMIIPSVAPG